MQRLSLEQFTHLLDQAQLKPRLKREVRFTSSTATMSDQDWQDSELLSISGRTSTQGVLIIAPDEDYFLLPYTLIKGLANKGTGRTKPIICDFCRTWQAGNNAGSITFQKDRQLINSVSFLCCADLACSKHIRGQTSASRLSRAQLRENITDQQRVERCKNQLRTIIADLPIQALQLP